MEANGWTFNDITEYWNNVYGQCKEKYHYDEHKGKCHPTTYPKDDDYDWVACPKSETDDKYENCDICAKK